LDGALPALGAFRYPIAQGDQAHAKKPLQVGRRLLDNNNILFPSRAAGERRMRFIECPRMEKSKTPDQERGF
jgi:hypothetical protein